MTIALKEIHISNEKKRDANVRFVSLIKENDPKIAYKGKSIKNSRLLISSDETSEESLIKQYKSKLAENILNNDVDVDIEYAGKFIGDTDRILFNSKNKILYSPPKIKEVLFNKYKIEIPLMKSDDQLFIRMSVQCYNAQKDIDYLFNVLEKLNKPSDLIH